jgi:aldose 1-epimerase
MSITQRVYGHLQDGTAVTLYTLSNDRGLGADITDYGGIIVSLRVPDRDGNAGDIVLGFDEFEPYLRDHPYFGALIGRYGNRIADGKFTLNGRAFTLARNNGPNHLHGGIKGFDKVVWRAQASDSPAPTLTLTYHSADGEEGYPGNLDTTVVYTLDGDELRIDYAATTDQDTVLNLTNHSYFNLAGRGTILDHELELAAESFLPTNERQIPTGEMRPVRGTPMDFTRPTAVGARIAANDEQLQIGGGGYDHNWVLGADDGAERFAARVFDPGSGRVMEVYTTHPGVQLYTANGLDGSLKGKRGEPYGKYGALCLETQHFPDSPNQLQFPSTVLKAGGVYRHTTRFRFSTRP